MSRTGAVRVAARNVRPHQASQWEAFRGIPETCHALEIPISSVHVSRYLR